MGDVHDLGARLRALRKLRGLSNDELCVRLRNQGVKVTVSRLYQIERGEGYPTPELLIGWGELLKATEADLPELTLARARRALDENAVGMAQALRLARQITGADDGSTPTRSAHRVAREADKLPAAKRSRAARRPRKAG